MKQVNQSVLKAECDNKQASGSSYSTKSHSSSNKSNPYAFMIADMILSMMMEIMTGTDIRKDKDYADGVDDAMEELDEDW